MPENTQKNNDWKERELGALWRKESNGGKRYLSGRLKIDGEDIEVVMFPNTKKEAGSNAPDFNLYRSRPRETLVATGKTTTKTAVKPKQTAPVQQEADVEDPLLA